MTSFTETESEMGCVLKGPTQDTPFSTPMQTKVANPTTPPLHSLKDHSKAEFSVHGIKSQKLEFPRQSTESSSAPAPPTATVSVKTEESFIPSLPPMTAWSPDDDLPMIELKDPDADSNQRQPLRLGGYSYRLKYDGKTTATYHCKSSRSCKCPGKIKFLKKTGEYQEQEPHSAQCEAKSAGGGKIELENGTTDLTEFQRDLIESLATDFTKTADPIAEEVIRECDSIGGPYIGMRKNEVSRLNVFWCFGVGCTFVLSHFLSIMSRYDHVWCCGVLVVCCFVCVLNMFLRVAFLRIMSRYSFWCFGVFVFTISCINCSRCKLTFPFN